MLNSSIYLTDSCPTHPTFIRMESDMGYIMETSAKERYEAREYCRTNFASPTYFPDIKNYDYFLEALGALHITTGKNFFFLTPGKNITALFLHSTSTKCFQVPQLIVIYND